MTTLPLRVRLLSAASSRHQIWQRPEQACASTLAAGVRPVLSPPPTCRRAALTSCACPTPRPLQALPPIFLPDGSLNYRLLALVLLIAATVATTAAFVLSCVELRASLAEEAAEAASQAEQAEGYQPLLAGWQETPAYQKVVINPLAASLA